MATAAAASHRLQSPFIHFPRTSIWNSPSKKCLMMRAEIEIRVCVNRSCSRLGSRQTLETLSGIAPPDVSVRSSGCLGRCGAGPNVVILPKEIFIAHCGTAAQAAQLMGSICGCEWNPSNNLTALTLRKKGDGELEKGNHCEAESLFSQAIDLKPSGGLHIIYKSRSAARLALGNHSSALEDAKESSRVCPSYPEAYIFQGDAFSALDKFHEAEEAYAFALSLDPSIRRSKSYKARVSNLKEKLTTSSISS